MLVSNNDVSSTDVRVLYVPNALRDSYTAPALLSRQIDFMVSSMMTTPTSENDHTMTNMPA